jgi:hypothetical protein
MKLFGKRARKAVVRSILCAVLLTCVACALLFWDKGCGLGTLLTKAVESKLARNRLLCKTNYHMLLASSRELLKMAAEGKLKPGVYRVACTPPSPEAAHFPKPILDLAPQLVTIDEDGWLSIEMVGSGFEHCGVLAYPEDFKAPYPSFEYGRRRLTEGLWYYDDEYNGDPGYDIVIDKLIRRGERYQSQ